MEIIKNFDPKSQYPIFAKQSKNLLIEQNYEPGDERRKKKDKHKSGKHDGEGNVKKQKR